MYVHTEPVAVEAGRGSSSLISRGKTVASSAVQKPISLSTSSASGKNEIFVDILERLTILFNSNGYVLNSTIDGCIQMKSYLSGNPGLRLALNEDLVVGKENAIGYAGVVLDDCNFHECVNLDDFDATKTLAMIPPDGEFVVMNYRITSEFRPPFRIFPVLEETSPYKVELVLKVRGDFPEAQHGINVTIRFPVPKTSATVTPELSSNISSAMGIANGVRGAPVTASSSGQAVEYLGKDHEVVWSIKKFQGQQEFTLRTRITLSAPSTATIRKEVGPISLSFEIPNYNVSGLQVKYLRIAETHKGYKPQRWVRYVSTSSSYVCRL
jgi:AP-4 complex subunit mu-1